MHVTRAAKRHSIVADILVAAVYGERTGEWTARKLRGMQGVSIWRATKQWAQQEFATCA